MKNGGKGMLKQLFKNVSFYASCLVVFLAGLIYVLLSDVYLGNTAGWLFISILLSFGSGICFVLGETFKEKRWLTFVLKGVAIALAIGFIVFLYMFKASDFCNSLMVQKHKIRDITIILTLILSYLAVIVQTANIVLNAIFKED